MGKPRFLSEGSTTQLPRVSGGKSGSALAPRILQWLLIAVLIGLGSGLSGGLSYGLSSDLFYVQQAQQHVQQHLLHYELFVGLSFGLCYGLCSILLQALLVRRNIAQSPSQTLPQGWRTKWQRLIRRREVRNGLLVGSLVALSAGLSAGLLSILLIGSGTAVQPTDLLVWSWRSLGKSLFLKSHISTTRQVTVLIGLFVGLSCWLLLGLFQGVTSATIEDQIRMVPNQGIRRSALNGLVFGLISTVIVGLLVWLSAGLSWGLSSGLGDVLDWGLSNGLLTGVLAGLSTGLLIGLLYGGLASFRHYVLRFLLWRTGSIPWYYAPFLDYATERILLRKVGGGYIFLHRLLLDYFASLDIPSSEEAPAVSASLQKPDEKE